MTIYFINIKRNIVLQTLLRALTGYADILSGTNDAGNCLFMSTPY